jgi:hypothetical protein
MPMLALSGKLPGPYREVPLRRCSEKRHDRGEFYAEKGLNFKGSGELSGKLPGPYREVPLRRCSEKRHDRDEFYAEKGLNFKGFGVGAVREPPVHDPSGGAGFGRALSRTGASAYIGRGGADHARGCRLRP